MRKSRFPVRLLIILTFVLLVGSTTLYVFATSSSKSLARPSASDAATAPTVLFPGQSAVHGTEQVTLMQVVFPKAINETKAPDGTLFVVAAYVLKNFGSTYLTAAYIQPPHLVDHLGRAYDQDPALSAEAASVVNASSRLTSPLAPGGAVTLVAAYAVAADRFNPRAMGIQFADDILYELGPGTTIPGIASRDASDASAADSASSDATADSDNQDEPSQPQAIAQPVIQAPISVGAQSVPLINPQDLPSNDEPPPATMLEPGNIAPEGLGPTVQIPDASSTDQSSGDQAPPQAGN